MKHTTTGIIIAVGAVAVLSLGVIMRRNSQQMVTSLPNPSELETSISELDESIQLEEKKATMIQEGGNTKQTAEASPLPVVSQSSKDEELTAALNSLDSEMLGVAPGQNDLADIQ